MSGEGSDSCFAFAECYSFKTSLPTNGSGGEVKVLCCMDKLKAAYFKEVRSFIYWQFQSIRQ